MLVESFGRNSQLLVEWLAYHRLQGFEQFLLYINEDSAKLRALLRTHIEQGFVNVVEWQWRKTNTSSWAHQIPQLSSCIWRFRGVAK